MAGCAALVREYLASKGADEPSAALVKAILINGTRWLTGPDSIADFPNSPNYHQGFGAVFMPWSIPNPQVPDLKLEFVDNWKNQEDQLARTGQRMRYRLSVGTKMHLALCLAYTDLPARGLQNNLDLFVQHLPSKQKWMGNENVPQTMHIPDPDNNVEVVRLNNPPAGDYLVQVSARNLLEGPQDFALVAAGDLQSGLTPTF